MLVNFTDLNNACPKDPYLLPHIDQLIDGASVFRLLNFMDAYSGYNQIQMNLLDAPKMAFMTNRNNYYYEVMSFRLKNAGVTYQRLMDMVFASQIWRNLEVYVDYMVIKTPENQKHVKYLEETFASIRSYNMRLNPDKCTFEVQAGKFLGFMLTNRGIKENLDKCQTIINMRIPLIVKEVQQLTGQLAYLSCLSCAGDKLIHFFAALKKSAKF